MLERTNWLWFGFDRLSVISDENLIEFFFQPSSHDFNGKLKSGWWSLELIVVELEDLLKFNWPEAWECNPQSSELGEGDNSKNTEFFLQSGFCCQFLSMLSDCFFANDLITKNKILSFAKQKTSKSHEVCELDSMIFILFNYFYHRQVFDNNSLFHRFV